MTRNSMILGAAILVGAAYSHPSISAPLEGSGQSGFLLLAQAPVTTPASPAEREREREREREGRPPGQRPAQGAPGAATPERPQQQRPGGAPAAQAVPANPPPAAQPQTPPGQQPRTAPATAQTPANPVPRTGAPAVPAPAAQAPVNPPPPVQAQTPPAQPPRPGAPAAQQNTAPPPSGSQRPAAGAVAPVVPPPAQAQTPPGQQPARPGALPPQQNAVPLAPGLRPPGAAGVVPGAAPAAQMPAAQAPAQPARPGVPPVANAPVDPRTMPQHLDQLRSERRETQDGNRTVIQESDRTIIREGGHDIIRHDEAGRFRYNAREVNVERRGNLSVTVVVRPDGTRIVTETDDDGRLIRRVRRDAFGREVIIIDNSFAPPRGPGFAGFFVELPPPVIRVPRELYVRELARASAEDIYLTLMAPPVDRIVRRYGLDEIRYSEPLRARMPRIDIDTVNFQTGSWEIAPDQAQRLAFVAQGITRAVQRNPGEVFLVEGHTDAVGNEVDNLSLSDRRAEAVAVMLTNQFGVPAENLSTQGYGKQFLKVPADGPERTNRRVAVRRITPLLTGQN